jgi:hypothetical protein
MPARAAERCDCGAHLVKARVPSENPSFGSANPARTHRRDDARGGVGRARPRRVCRCRDWSPPVHRGALTPSASPSSTALPRRRARSRHGTVGSPWTALPRSLSRGRVAHSSASRRSGSAAPRRLLVNPIPCTLCICHSSK